MNISAQCLFVLVTSPTFSQATSYNYSNVDSKVGHSPQKLRHNIYWTVLCNCVVSYLDIISFCKDQSDFASVRYCWICQQNYADIKRIIMFRFTFGSTVHSWSLRSSRWMSLNTLLTHPLRYLHKI